MTSAPEPSIAQWLCDEQAAVPHLALLVNRTLVVLALPRPFLLSLLPPGLRVVDWCVSRFNVQGSQGSPYRCQHDANEDAE